jgi:hypothetical protein
VGLDRMDELNSHFSHFHEHARKVYKPVNCIKIKKVEKIKERVNCGKLSAEGSVILKWIEECV